MGDCPIIKIILIFSWENLLLGSKLYIYEKTKIEIWEVKNSFKKR